MTMSRIETYEAAAVLAVDAVRGISLEEVLKRHPDPVEARAVQEAILVSHVGMEWRGTWLPGLNRTVKVAAVIGFPLVVPVLAIMHIAWGFDRLTRYVIGKVRRGTH